MADLTKINSSVVTVDEVSEALRVAEPLQTTLDLLEADVDDLISSIERNAIDASITDLTTRTNDADSATDNIESLLNNSTLDSAKIDKFTKSVTSLTRSLDGAYCVVQHGTYYSLEMITLDEFPKYASYTDDEAITTFRSSNRRHNTRELKDETGPILNVMSDGNTCVAYTTNDGIQNELVVHDLLLNKELRTAIPNGTTALHFEANNRFGTIYLGFSNSVIKKFERADSESAYTETWSANYSLGEITCLATATVGGNLYAGGRNGSISVINSSNNSVIFSRQVHTNSASSNYIFKILPLSRFGFNGFAVVTRSKSFTTTLDNFHIISDSNIAVDSIYLNQFSGSEHIIDCSVLNSPLQVVSTSSSEIRFMAVTAGSGHYQTYNKMVLFVFDGSDIKTFSKTGANSSPTFVIDTFRKWYHDNTATSYGGVIADDAIIAGGITSQDDSRIIPMSTGEVIFFQIIDDINASSYAAQVFHSESYTMYESNGGDIDVGTIGVELVPAQFKNGKIISAAPIRGRIELGQHEEII